jgi:hypothetical protein
VGFAGGNRAPSTNRLVGHCTGLYKHLPFCPFGGFCPFSGVNNLRVFRQAGEFESHQVHQNVSHTYRPPPAKNVITGVHLESKFGRRVGNQDNEAPSVPTRCQGVCSSRQVFSVASDGYRCRASIS